MKHELDDLTQEMKAWETLKNLSLTSSETLDNRYPVRFEDAKVVLPENVESSSLQNGLIYAAMGADAVHVLQMLLDDGLVCVSTVARNMCAITLTEEGERTVEAGQNASFASGLRSVKELVHEVERSNHHPVPDFTQITAAIPEFDQLLQARWREADICHRAGAYFSAIVLMGSILEAILTARVCLEPKSFWVPANAPKDSKGAVRPIEDWGLGNLIAVSVEQRWLGPDRSHFSHALKESRNVVHPFIHIRTRLDFDERTSRACWEILQGAIEDLSQSIHPPETGP